MKPDEAIPYLQAILDDTLDPNDETDTRRITALELALELMRNHVSRKNGRPRLSSPNAAYQQVKHLSRKRTERLVGLYVDAQNRLIRRVTLSVGSLNTTMTHPREILHPAITAGAIGFILAHNHPSGSQEPSQDDVEFTRAIKRAADIIGIPLHDHLIVADGWFVSLKEKGLV